MKKAGLVGPSYQERSLPFDAQRTINLIPVMDESGQGKEVSALYGTPGKSLFVTTGVGQIRAAFTATNERCFVVSGSELYELYSNQTATLRGTLQGGSGAVTIAENGSELAICDAQYVYIFNYSTNVLTQVADTDIPSASSITFIDGYFIVSKNASGAFYLSGLYDGTSWDPLDFATAESSPDNLVRVFNAVGLLWLFGAKTSEIWSNIGGTGFPFARVSGAKLEVGCASPYSVVSLDNSVFWIHSDNKGSGIVYRANGFTPERISTFAIEKLLQDAGDFESIRSYAYQEDGHTFYIITGGGLTTSLVFDVSTKQWHERSFLNNGELSQDLGSCATFAFGKILIGDRTSSKVYEQSLDIFSDNSSPIQRQRTFTHISNDGESFRIKSLLVDFEYGVGLQTGQGSNPLCWLEVSKDGGLTWGNKVYTSIGAVGKRGGRAIFHKIGHFDRQATFRISISDPVKVAICGAYYE